MSTAKSAQLLLPVAIMLGAFVMPSYAALLPSTPYQYTEQRPDNFVLSEETPISIGHGILGYMTTSTEPVDILSYGMHFRIPRNYIYTILDNTRDHAVDFQLQTLYPDFAGAKDEATIKTQIGTQNWQASMNQIVIYEDAQPDYPTGINQNTYVFAAEANEPDHLWKYGLLKSSKPSPAHGQDIYFQRPTKKSRGIVISCDKDDNTGCSVSVSVSSRIMITYQYHPELLSHWQEINEGVTKLIQSFIIKEN